jgi:hypothetical protein
MADVGDPPIALLVYDRLVRATRLEIVEADQLHVVRFGALLGDDAVIARDGERGEHDRDRGGR